MAPKSRAVKARVYAPHAATPVTPIRIVIAGSAYYGNAKSFEEELDDLIDPDVADEMDSVIGEAEEILEELVDLYVEEHGSEPTEDEFLAWPLLSEK